MTRKVITLASVLVTVVVAASVTTVVAATVDSDSRATTQTPEPRPTGATSSSETNDGPETLLAETATEVDPRLANDFAVFRKPADGGAPTTAEKSTYGVNNALARTVTLEVGSVTLVPGATGACMRVPDAMSPGVTAVACDPFDRALSGGILLSQRTERGALINAYGLVPDGVDEVTVGGDGAAVGVVPVIENVWYAKAPNGSAISYVTTSGEKVTHPIP